MRWLLLLCAAGCATTSSTALNAVDREDARILWVGAHPDDEALASAVLARACIKNRRPCHFFVFNRGDGGECLLREGCRPDTGTVRAREMSLVAEAYGATLEHHRYFNAPLPMSSFPPRHELAARWVEEGDPIERLSKTIRTFKPTVLLTFDPDTGFTGHPEHQLASRFALEAVRRVSKEHRVPSIYYVLNEYWPMQALGGGDDRSSTETFDTHVSCGSSARPARTCLDVALAVTKAHRTQSGDMGRVRAFRPQLGRLYLFAVDPFDPEAAPSPFEPAED